VTGGGVFGASFGGLVSPTTAKLISVAADTYYPGAYASVTSPGPGAPAIRRVNLSSRYQRLFLAGNEELRVDWAGEPQRVRRLSIILQDLSEHECTPFMRVEHRPQKFMSRYLLQIAGGGPFAYGTNPLQPDWQWDPVLGIRRALLPSGNGYLTVGDLDDHAYRRGIYVWARFSGAPGNVGTVGQAALMSPEFGDVAAVPNMEWTKPLWLSATDRLTFKANGGAEGGVNLELDVAPARIRKLTGVA
ncbi:MAG: hypothetical protein ACPG4T_07345, partial [Nannocystaceae bacterium]